MILRQSLKRRDVLALTVFALLACVLVFAGCGRSNEPGVQAAQSQGPAANSATPADYAAPPEIPIGTVISVRLLRTISSRSAHAGEEYDAELASPLIVEGQTLFSQSAHARIRVISAEESGRLENPGRLAVTLDSIQDQSGKWIPIDTSPLSAKGQSHKKRNVTLIGGGSALGAAIGALAGGGKGAAIGALSGAGAGSAGAYATGKKDVAYSAETVLRFRTRAEVSMNQ